jgi:hypothetical protein
MTQREPQTGLDLPEHLGIGEREAADVKTKWDTFDQMELAMTQMGFPPVEKPKVIRPILTPDLLTNPDDKMYTEVYYGVKEWHNYTVNTLSRIRAAMLQIPNEKREIERRVRHNILSNLKPGEKKPTVQQLKDAVEADPRYEELLLEKQKLEQQEFLIKSHADGLAEDLKLCSRNVEIRKQEKEFGNSQAGHPRFRPPGFGAPPGRVP